MTLKNNAMHQVYNWKCGPNQEIYSLSIRDKIRTEEPNSLFYFEKVLNELKKNKDNNVMVELGCGEAIYSAFFREYLGEKSKNILVEPDFDGSWKSFFGAKYFLGRDNVYFYNKFVGNPVNAHWGGLENLNFSKEIGSISLNELIKDTNTEKIDILHMDLQGSEYYILKDIIENQIIKKINYIFIYTHEFNDDISLKSIKYEDYLKLLESSNFNYEFIFKDSSLRENGDGEIIIRIL